ncbi:MAG: 6-hydroxymethylpterin diphosphokinase MptE-like protein [Candidatus Helarchaeota archaeon]
MEWREWEPYYRIIVEQMGIDTVKDENAAIELNNLLMNKINVNKIENKISSLLEEANVLIYGCGPSLRNSLEQLKEYKLNSINIAADGAVSGLLEYGMKCHINVSDLDGDINDILKANSLGTITVIHAHGDNIDLIKKYVPRFTGDILGTVQTKPLGNLVNYGGFTDGDRCIFLALKFKVSKIILVGFDFGPVVGEYSKPGLQEHNATQNKSIKLEFASFLISKILKRYKIKIFSLSKETNVKGLKYISKDELVKLIKKRN